MGQIKKMIPPNGNSAAVEKSEGIYVGSQLTLPMLDNLYYPLFPEAGRGIATKEKYFHVHDLLIARMREQTRLKNRPEIERTGRKLALLRKKYRSRFAA